MLPMNVERILSMRQSVEIAGGAEVRLERVSEDTAQSHFGFTLNADESCGISSGMLEAMPCLALIARDGLVIWRNGLARRASGLTHVALAPVTLEQVLSGSDGAFEVPAEGQRIRFDCRLLRPHGPSMPVSGAAQRINFRGESATLLLLLEQAQEAEVEAAPEGSFLEDVLDATPGATVVTHGGRVLHVNAEFSKMFDYSQLESVGQFLDDLVLPDGRMHEAEMIEHQLGRMGRATLETQRRTRTGHNLDVLVMVSPLRLGGEAGGQFVTYRDIHVEKEEEARLRHSALHDGLTGLANRGLFLNRAELMLSRLRRRPDRGFAIFFIDLDGFKKVNDKLGHAAGDAVLLEVAARILRCVRPQDTVARFGGDEFALLLDETGSLAEVNRVALRLQTEISVEIALEAGAARVGASIGIALAANGYEDADAMLQDADRAMYEAKKRGKGQHQICHEPGYFDAVEDSKV